MTLVKQETPIITRPTFNPKYYEVGAAFSMNAHKALKSMDDRVNQFIKYGTINVLVIGITDRGETLQVVGVIKYDGYYKPIEILVKIEEADGIDFTPLKPPEVIPADAFK